MKYIVLLSGKDTPLAFEEFKSVLQKQGADLDILHQYSDRLFIMDLKKQIFFSDLAQTRSISRLLGTAEDYNSVEWKNHIDGTAAVRSIKIPGSYICESSLIEKRIGASIYDSGIKIDLDNPQNIITLYLSPQIRLLGSQVFASSDNTFSSRKPDVRPFRKPISLDPQVARTMLNLARVKAGDSVADPFAGTGGILIEAGLMKCRVFGMDIDAEMVDGTMKNLDYFNIRSYKLKVGDAFDLRSMFGDTFDTIVTDFPYSKNTKNVDSRNIAQKYIEYIPSVLNPNRYACIASNHSDLDIPSTLELTFKYEIILHKSLSKFIYVLKKK